MATAEPGQGAAANDAPVRSSRSAEEIRGRFASWLAQRMGADAAPVVTGVSGTTGNGLSSETLLFDVEWRANGATERGALVVRMAPDPADVPVFPTYRLDLQYRTIEAVRTETDVPVPPLRFLEEDPSHLGSPFFVMEQVAGRVPGDIPPYVFPGSWVADATPAERRALQDGVVEVLAELHGIADPERRFGFLGAGGVGSAADALGRHVAERRAWYRFAAADLGRCDVIERAFAWLDDHWPSDPGPTVLSWGDSRIGNVIFDGFTPAAVLDWEMAGLGPRELDVAWLLYCHQLFQFTAGTVGLEGLPDLLQVDDVAEEYARRTGHELRHLPVYELYSAVQLGIVGMRTGLRSITFGETSMPDRVDDLLFNRGQIEELLAAASRKP